MWGWNLASRIEKGIRKMKRGEVNLAARNVAPSTRPPGRTGNSMVRSSSSSSPKYDFDFSLLLLLLFLALFLLGDDAVGSGGLEGRVYTNRLCVVAITSYWSGVSCRCGMKVRRLTVVEEKVASYISCVVCMGSAARPSNGYVSKDS